MEAEAERRRAQSSAEPAEPSASGLAELSSAVAAEGATGAGDFAGEEAATATPPFTAAAAGGVSVERGEGGKGATDGGIWMREFSEEGPDGTFHFQVVKLIQQDPMPLVTPLIGGGAEGASATMAARLSKRLGCAVILASNIPPNAPMTEATAERLLIKRLPMLLSEQSNT